MDEQGIQTLSEALRCTSGVRSEEGQTSANNLFMRAFLAEGKPAWTVCAFVRRLFRLLCGKAFCIGACRGAKRPDFDSLLPGV